jgi:tRNA/rRNA methyltransferase
MADPAIILVEPQLGENIGTAARAMANFGLLDLRIVNPREGWPNEKAVTSSSGSPTIEHARVFGTVAEAIADLRFVYATTAREREVAKPVAGPRAAVTRMRELAGEGVTPGILFGRERTGLSNEEVSLADAILTLPVDPRFTSLNVAQAVLVMAYEWRLSGFAEEGAALPFGTPDDPPAPKEALLHLFEHLESALEAVNFFRPAEKKPHVVASLRNILQRAQMSEPEVRSLRGVIAALERRPTRPHRLPDGTITTDRGKFE